MNYGKKGVQEKQKALKNTGTKWGRKIFLFIITLMLIGIVSIGIIGASAGLGMFNGILASSPDITNLQVTPTGFSTFIYNSEGQQTAKLVASNANRIPVTMEQVPQDMADAFVAIEDERFYTHHGIDIQGILRAAVTGVANGFNFTEGASTITQQLLKNNVFTDWTSEDSFLDSLKRKIQEQYLALELEKTMDKEDILINYMNTINLGQSTLGVQAASLRYFNKSVSELTLSECTVIAGITQNPTMYNPITNPDNNAEKRAIVLKNMLTQGYITQDEYDEALADDVYSRIQVTNEEMDTASVNSYFDDAVTDAVYADLLEAGYSDNQTYTLLYTGGLSIYSTQDPDIATICEDVFSNEENYPDGTQYYLTYALSIEEADGSVTNHSSEMYRTYFRETNSKFNMLYDSTEEAYLGIEEYTNAHLSEGASVLAESISITPQPQVSITVQDQSTGHVVAMIGGRGEKTANKTLNRATSTTRQPGSTFKVLAAFAPAIDSAGLTLATVFNDAPFNYEDGTPVSNWYSTGYRGLNSIRTAIRDSMNIIAVKTLTQITPQLGFDYLTNFGFTTLETAKEVNGQIFTDIHQSLALGGITNGVTNLELNAAYATIANSGTYIEPILYTKVVDSEGNVILDNTTPETKQVIKDTTAFLLTDAMVDVVTSGTGTSVNFGGVPIAGKTGTTSDYKDVWFSGYTPYYTASTWTGYDNNEVLSSSAEKNLAKTLWRKVMEEIHVDLPTTSFPVPSGIVTATVCSQSGKLPIAGLCDATLTTEYFADGTVPTETCDVHFQGNICTYTGLRACETCPFQQEGIFELIPAEDASLLAGSSTLTNTTTTDNVTVVESASGDEATDTTTSTMCPHSEAFFADPNAESIIEQQRAELVAAAQAAADAATVIIEATEAEATETAVSNETTETTE
ncbi:MAG: transglycosylase domain-containing protein [Eubacteriales bacterium]